MVLQNEIKPHLLKMPARPDFLPSWKSLAVCLSTALSVAPVFAAEMISLESLLREMTDLEAPARWPEPAYTNREASSHDRATVAPDKPGWWANNDFSQFIRTEEINGRQENVMLDADGPGSLVRFWLTAAKPKKGTLRIYLDGNAEPALVFDSFDLEAGSLRLSSPLIHRHESHTSEAGGNTLLLPIPYAKHCKVTWEEGEIPAQRYYQINYRTYPPGTVVKTWTEQQMEDHAPLVGQTGRLLQSPTRSAEGTVTTLNRKLGAGESAPLPLPPGPSAVRSLELVLDAGDLSQAEIERALRGVILQMTADGEQTVWCPATDFFGTGAGIHEARNFYQSVASDGTLRCRWVMPYAKNATLSLINLGTTPVMATIHATTSPWKWDEQSMHFNARWHFATGLQTMTGHDLQKNTKVKDWNFISIKGRGVYVGDSLSLFNPIATWYGEGDEKITVDGETLPSHLGTGTEDYYGYSYAPRGIFQTPFVNQNRIDSHSTRGYNVMSRVRPLDAIAFNRSLNFDIELISWEPTTLTYAATTYWYAFPGATSNIVPQPEDATRPIQTLEQALDALKMKPGAIEAERLRVTGNSPGFDPGPQDMRPWDGNRWSSKQHLLAKAQKPGDFVELEIPADGNGARRLLIHATRGPDYGKLKFSVNGKPTETVFDGYSKDVEPGPVIDLGVVTPRSGKFVLRVEVAGSNPEAKSPGTLFGIDYLELMAP